MSEELFGLDNVGKGDPGCNDKNIVVWPDNTVPETCSKLPCSSPPTCEKILQDFKPKISLDGGIQFDTCNSYSRDSFVKSGKNELTTLGKYIQQVSACPQVMGKHMRNALNVNVNWQEKSSVKFSKRLQIKNYKAVHRIFNTIIAFRNFCGADFAKGHVRKIWGTQVEDVLRSFLTTSGIIQGVDSKGKPASGAYTGLGTTFHFINALTANPNILQMQVQDLWDLPRSQNFINKMFTDAGFIQPCPTAKTSDNKIFQSYSKLCATTPGSKALPAGGLWIAIEIMNGAPSVHATWDALAIINRLFFLHGCEIFTVWRKNTERCLAVQAMTHLLMNLPQDQSQVPTVPTYTRLNKDLPVLKDYSGESEDEIKEWAGRCVDELAKSGGKNGVQYLIFLMKNIMDPVAFPLPPDFPCNMPDALPPCAGVM